MSNAPNLPNLGNLLRKEEHLTMYSFDPVDAEPTRGGSVTNPFGEEEF
jgi:hypothetical protein